MKKRLIKIIGVLLVLFLLVGAVFSGVWLKETRADSGITIIASYPNRGLEVSDLDDNNDYKWSDDITLHLTDEEVANEGGISRKKMEILIQNEPDYKSNPKEYMTWYANNHISALNAFRWLSQANDLYFEYDLATQLKLDNKYKISLSGLVEDMSFLDFEKEMSNFNWLDVAVVDFRNVIRRYEYDSLIEIINNNDNISTIEEARDFVYSDVDYIKTKLSSIFEEIEYYLESFDYYKDKYSELIDEIDNINNFDDPEFRLKVLDNDSTTHDKSYRSLILNYLDLYYRYREYYADSHKRNVKVSKSSNNNSKDYSFELKVENYTNFDEESTAYSNMNNSSWINEGLVFPQDLITVIKYSSLDEEIDRYSVNITNDTNFYRDIDSNSVINAPFNFTLKNGEYITFDLPAILDYSITETTYDGYSTVVDVNDNKTEGNVADVKGVPTTVDNITETYSDTIEFSNIYSATGQATISGKKVVTGKENADDLEPFSFVLKDENGEELDTVTNDTNGDFSFTIDYELADAGKEFTYTIAETDAGAENTVYDNHTETVKVKVSDNGDGTLKADVTYDDDGAVFTNSYLTDVSITKIWDDENDHDGLRPSMAEFLEKIHLYADDDEVDLTDESFTITTTGGDSEAEDNTSIEGSTVSGGDATQGSVDTEDDGNRYIINIAGLPKYAQGEPIEYTISEDSIDKYTASDIKGDMINGFTITNTHTPVKGYQRVYKRWQDDSNRDGKRPDSITLNLYEMEFIPNEYGYAMFTGNVKKVDSYTMTAEDSTDSSDVWEHTFDNLDMYRDGKLIYYGVGEEDVPSLDEADEAQYYFSTIKIDSSGSVVYKTDIDGKNKYIFVSELVPSFRVSSSIHEKYYSWALAFGNNYTPESLDISGKKTWIDADNKDASRPASVKVYLMKNGEDFQTYEMSEATGWTYEFPNLYKYEDGQEIEYTIEEEEVPGYTTEYETTVDEENNTVTTDITNTYVRDIPVTKIWDDASDQDGKRPESITVKLLAGNEEYGTYDLNEANDWTYTFTDLPKFNTRGNEIAYTIEEVSVADYTTRITGSAADGYTITNSHTPEKLDIKGKKIWDDAFDQDGKRQGFVTVRLLKDNEEFKKETVTEEDNWSYSFLDLDKYENGREIEYSISETPVQDYTKELIPTADGYDLKNTHTPETVDITVEKTWDDADDQDGFRPESIKVNLLADNVKVDQAEVRPDAAGKWAYTFSDKPKYNNGIEIAYTVSEEAVDKYRASQDGLKITNIHTPETVDISGTKTWVDGDDQDGIRPAYVAVKLLADGTEVKKQTITDDDDWKYEFTDMPKYKDGKEIVYTLDEVAVAGYTVTKDGYNLTNTHTPETTEFEVSKVWDDAFDKDGLRPDSVEVTLYADDKEAGKIELSKDNDWSYKWTGLPKYAEGTEITYTVEEAPVTGYTTVIEGGTITNTHIPAPELIDIPVTKVWSDNDDNDGKRPESVIVNLLADGELCETYELKAEEGWKHTFADLAKFNEDKEINYTIEEITSDGYSCTISGDAKDGFTITNTHTPETGSVFAFKVWDDNNNKDGKRPDSITLQLLGDGEPVEGQEDKVIAKDADNTMVSWTDLPVYKDGKEIEYTVVEAGVTDGRLGEYEVDVTETIIGFVITNRISEETVDVKATKVWDDDNDRDRKRPAEVTFLLYADGVPTGDTKKVTAETPSVTWTDLPKNKDGAVNVPINYEVKEEQSKALTDAKYTQNTSGDALNGFIITNSRTTDKTEVPVTKIWSDADDQDGKRPESVTVLLKADGETVGSQELTEDSGWQFTWTGLNKYKDGKEIEYTVDEAAVAGYTKSISGTTITNTYTPETVDLTVEKAWSDSDDQDGKRPSSVTAKLLADGKEVASQALSAANGWKYTFTGLPKFNSGKEIVYTVAEDPVAGYEADINGLKITNVHQAETTEVKATKVWNDDSNRDGKRTDVTLQLQADGQVLLGSDKLIAKNASDTTVSWTDLPKYNDGKEITYSVVEAGVVDNKLGDYAVQITGDAESGFTVTNSYTPETLDISGVKTWNDDNDRDKKRPDSIRINLLANGKVVDSTTVDAAGSGNYEFKDLPKFENGTEITYAVTEDPVDGYATTVDGYNITNTYTTEKTKITVIKKWDDAGNQDAKRPDSVNVAVRGNGGLAGTAVLSAENNWSYTWDNLPKKENGEDISYTVAETEPEGYTAEVTETAEGVFEITNKYTPETVEIKATKVWSDDNNRDGKRGDVTLQLQADGQVIAGQDKTIAKDAAATTVAWTDLPKYNDGKEIAYSVVEAGVVGDKLGDYSVSVTGDANTGFTIINSYTPETVTVSGTKTWDDDSDRDGIRPASVTVDLLKNGEKTDSAIVDEASGWKYEFKNLPKYEAGEEITYTVSETVTGAYNPDISGYDITNRYTPETTQVTVTKVWNDSSDQDGKRPDKINVSLTADGVDTGKTAELSEKNDWTFTWLGLPAKENGRYIVYDVAESETVTGYTSVKTGDAKAGFTLTNSYTPETVDVSGVKTWNDDDNRDGLRPESITVNLLKNGKVSDTKTVTAANGWSYEWTGLPKFEKGSEITYTVTEEAVADYTSVISGYNVTNSYTPETTGVTVVKVWNDEDDIDGLRPAAVTVALRGNGGLVGSAELSAENNWTYTWTGLPKKENGADISYAVVEAAVEGYESEVTGSASSAFVITNTHEHKEEEPVYVQVPVSKKDATTSEELPGAVLTIKNSEGAIVTNWISGTEPEVVTLEPGTYTLIEDKAPLGYAGEESITFTVTATGVEGGPVEMRDEPIVVNISKQAVGGGSELAGASLAVKGLSNDFAESWESGETAHVIERIPAGVYTLTETQAPEGYEIAETIVFRVNEDNTVECLDGEVWSAVTDNTVIMLDALKPDEPVTHEIEISKKDAASKEELPGAQLTVTDSEGNELYSWTSTNEARKITLKPGTYTLTEVTAPDWYEKAESITFTVDENGLVDADKVEMINAAQKVYDRFSVNVILAKGWTDADGNAIAWPEGSEVEFVLQYKDSKGNWADYTDDLGNPYTVKLNAELTEYVFEELPAVINGEVAQYRAVELTEVEGFKKAVSEPTDLAARLGRMEAVNVQEKSTEPTDSQEGHKEQPSDNKEEQSEPVNDGKDGKTDTTDSKETKTEETDKIDKKTTGTGTESSTKTSASGARRTATSASAGTAARNAAVTTSAATKATSTGDSDNTAQWIALAATAVTALVGAGYAMRRRRFNK